MAAGDESAERSQLPTGSLELVPILPRFEVELPAVAAAEDALTRAIHDSSGALSRSEQKLLLAAAGTQWPATVCCQAIPIETNHPGKPNDPLARFGNKLARYGPWCTRHDCDALLAAGLSESAIVAAVATVALGHFRCTLASGLGSESWPEQTQSDVPIDADMPVWHDTPAPFLVPNPVPNSDLEQPYSEIRALFGFVPALLHLQSGHPGMVDAEVKLIDALLGTEDHLTQIEKHCLLLSLAAANCNNYLVALHGEILNLIGATPQETMAPLDDFENAPLASPHKLFCRELRKLRILPGGRQERPDLRVLESCGFSKVQIVEGLAIAALANFLSTIQFGLGAVPDFPPLRAFHVKDLYLSPVDTRPTQHAVVSEDPESDLVSKLRAGEMEAFEELVRRNTRRIFRTLYGLLGNVEEARDATQDTFLKAFEHLGKFEGRSKLSTWLTSIAVNTGTELLRRRRPLESLDSEEDERGFRPRQVRSWVDDPEQTFAKSEMNELVREGVLRLPEKYRVALILRDINQLSTEDTAAALDLSIPATKARVLRGRLMLREALAPHFSKTGGARDV